MSSKARRRVAGCLVALTTTLAGLVGCAWLLHSGLAWPTHDEATLKAIRAESEHLMKTVPVTARSSSGDPIVGRDFVDVPENRWPPVIASFRPRLVIVDQTGVDFMVQPALDGGYGYFVPRTKRDAPNFLERYVYLGQGVYWYHPY